MNPDDRYNRRGGPGRVWAGLFLLLVGGTLLLYQMGFPLPAWMFSWHFFLVGLGLFVGIRHNFRGAGWLILILIGGIWMIQDFYPDINVNRFTWPCILIFIGFMIIFRPNRSWRHEIREEWARNHRRRAYRWHERRWGNYGSEPNPDDPNGGAGFTGPDYGGRSTTGFGSSKESFSSEDFIDSTSIFGGVHKKIVSKNFRGGDITTMLGGTEIDLTAADFTGTIRLDVTQIMGGTKIIVPPHWEVRSEVTAVFAGFEDKRQQPAMTNPEKVMIIDGTSIFGGIELKNY